MDFNLLDTYLHQEDKLEKASKINDLPPFSYDFLPTTVKNGIKAYIFDVASSRENNLVNWITPNMTIRKHSRYSPVPMHIHSWVEINYIYSGSCTQQINNKQYTLTKGQVILIDTDTPHSISQTSYNDIIINILIKRDYLTTAFLGRFSSGNVVSNFLVNSIVESTNHNNFIIFPSQNNRRIDYYFRELMYEFYNKSINSTDIIECFIVLIFTELINILGNNSNKSKKENSKTSVIPILRYIESNYKSCTLESTASFFNLNPYYLSKLIKKSTNFTYKELIQKQKLEYSLHLLLSTEISVQEIASMAGYENLSFFYKKFQQTYKMTPKNYRDKYK